SSNARRDCQGSRSQSLHSLSRLPTHVLAPSETARAMRKSAARHLMLWLGLCALSLAPTCGKRKPPLPPLERVPQSTEGLAGTPSSNQAILVCTAPLRNAG